MKVTCENCRCHREVDHPGKFECPCGHVIEVPDPASSLTLCSDCGRLVSKTARTCPGCGRSLSSTEKPSPDLIAGLWALGLLLPPLTSVVVIAITTVLYYRWKPDSPGKAAIIRKHGWWIFAVGIVGTVLMAVVAIQAARTILGELGPLLQ